MTKEFKIQIDGVTLTGNNDKVLWASNWEKIFELKEKGFLREKHYKNLFNHSDFFITAKAKQEQLKTRGKYLRDFFELKNFHLF